MLYPLARPGTASRLRLWSWTCTLVPVAHGVAWTGPGCARDPCRMSWPDLGGGHPRIRRSCASSRWGGFGCDRDGLARIQETIQPVRPNLPHAGSQVPNKIPLLQSPTITPVAGRRTPPTGAAHTSARNSHRNPSVRLRHAIRLVGPLVSPHTLSVSPPHFGCGARSRRGT